MHIKTNIEYQRYPEQGLFYNALLGFIIVVFRWCKVAFRTLVLLLAFYIIIVFLLACILL